ncbi:MAG: hypothetical protein ACKO2P_16855 [Planctomycetota bacterium]
MPDPFAYASITEHRLRRPRSGRRLAETSLSGHGRNSLRHLTFNSQQNSTGTLQLPPAGIGFPAMDGLLQIELTSHERDVLLRGLRYVRSAVMLETREPSAEDTRRRSGLLDEIQNLSQRLENTDPLPVGY